MYSLASGSEKDSKELASKTVIFSISQTHTWCIARAGTRLVGDIGAIRRLKRRRFRRIDKASGRLYHFATIGLTQNQKTSKRRG